MKFFKSSYCAASVIVTFILVVFSFNFSVYAAITSFSKGYGFGPDISEMKKADISLAGKVIDGDEMKVGDYILPESGISNFNNYYNGLNNIFVWQEKTVDGQMTYKKVYGGTGTYDGWYGYAENGNCAMNADSSYITGYSNKVINTDKGGPFILAAKSGRVSFGHYDIDLKGYNEFTILLSSYNQLPNTKLQLVQNKAEDSDQCAKSFDIATFESNGDVKVLGSDEIVGTVVNNGYYNSIEGYYTIKCIIDARTSVLKSSVEIRKYSDNSVVVSTPMKILPDVQFDINNIFGMRLAITDDIEDKTAAMISLDEFKLTKASAPLEMTTTQASLDNKPIPMNGGDVIFQFDNTIDKSKLSEGSVYVLDENDQIVSVSYRASSKKIIITFGQLETERKYRVFFNEIFSVDGGKGYSGEMYVYSTAKAALIVSSKPAVSGGKAQINASINNYSNTQDYILLATVFKDGAMIPGVYYKKVLADGGTKTPISISDITLPDSGEITYKLFLVDNLHNMCAVSDSINVK